MSEERDFLDFLEDIVEAMGEAESFIEGFSFEKYRAI